MSEKFMRFVHPILKSEIIINKRAIKRFNIELFRFAKTMMISLSDDLVREWLFLFNFPENEGDTLVLSKKSDFFDKSYNTQFVAKVLIIPDILYDEDLAIKAFCNHIYASKEMAPGRINTGRIIKNDFLTNNTCIYNINPSRELVWTNNGTKFIYFDKSDIRFGYLEEDIDAGLKRHTLEDFLNNIVVCKDSPNAIVEETLCDILLSNINEIIPSTYTGKGRIELYYNYKDKYSCRLIIKPINSKFQVVFGKFEKAEAPHVYYIRLFSSVYDLAPNISVITDKNMHEEDDTVYIAEPGQDVKVLRNIKIINTRTDYFTFFNVKSKKKFIYTSYDRQIYPIETEPVEIWENYP